MKYTIWIAVVLTVGFKAQAANYFDENFAAVLDSRKWQVPSEHVHLTNGALAFEGKNAAERVYLRTVEGGFHEQSFVSEVTLTIRKGIDTTGIAYFGMGLGQADPSFYNTPNIQPAVYAVINPSGFGNAAMAISIAGKETPGCFPGPGDGDHRIRITWDAKTKRMLFEVDSFWDRKTFKPQLSTTTPAIAYSFPFKGCHIFLGGGEGVSIADFSVRAASDAEIKAAPFDVRFESNARTWLPVGRTEPSSPSQEASACLNPRATSVDAFLAKLQGRMRLLACWYSGSALASSRTFNVTSRGEQIRADLKTSGTVWECSGTTKRISRARDSLDLELRYKLISGNAKPVGVAVAFDFSDWSTNNYVMIPAAVYNGNRSKIEHRGYCTGFNGEDYYNKNIPQITTELPQLSPEPDVISKVELNTGNVTTPGMCFFNPKTKQGFILLTEQQTRLQEEAGDLRPNPPPHVGGYAAVQSNSGLMVEESRDRKTATFVVSAPGVRERRPAFIGFAESSDRGLDWKANQEVTIRLRLYSFKATGIPDLLEKFMEVRKALTGPNHPRNITPFSETIDLLSKRIDSDSRFYDGSPYKYYKPESSLKICIGWIGGLMNTYPMLALGDEFHLNRVRSTFDFAIPAAQSKSGFYYASMNPDGKPSGRDWFPDNMVLTRQPGDLLFWMIKQFMLLRAQGKGDAINPEWEQSMKRLADAFVATWEKHGQWGNYINIESGDIAVYNTTSGAIVPGGLALASTYFNEPKYLKVAAEAAEFFYTHDFAKGGATTGACSDILQNAESETAIALTTSLMALHETTGDPSWLKKSRSVANLAATWVVSHDYKFPDNSQLGKLGMRAAGSVWASTQNKHCAPGFCTTSADALFKIYRATGERSYAELMRDIAHAHSEMVERADRKVYGGGPGAVNERIQLSDAEGEIYVGNGSFGDSTGWNELNGMLIALELPSVYLRTDRDECFVFDSIEARVIKRQKDGVILVITNPTLFTAKVTVLAEDGRQSKRPLGYTAFLKWPRVNVKPGETVRVKVAAEFKIHQL